MTKPLVCHVVAGYPDRPACLGLMKAMHAAGVAAIEVQIPFSDPIADGQSIMRANDVALANGLTTDGSFELISQARHQGVDNDIYIMSYAQKIRHYGFEDFCRQASACQASGLISPDLPYDSPDFKDLQLAAKPAGLKIVPVLSPGMSEQRLQAILAQAPTVVYVTSVRGITGNKYAPDAQLENLVKTIRRQTEAQIMIGFGIATPANVSDALALGDMAVVGSALVKAVEAGGQAKAIKLIKELAAA